MEALWKARRRDGLRVVGINLGEPAERVKAYVAEMKLTFPIVIDASGKVSNTYGVRFTPTHFLIDRAGIARAGGSGSREWNSALADAAVRILLETPAKTSKAPARPDRADSPPTGRTERR
ncbi:MAG: TlpA family protein disulfide reductase [Candidatus Rokubacteria bacterium]|nr:TlpA family protein disulfide reductase [Candidatus Rokubacteria bacterium]